MAERLVTIVTLLAFLVVLALVHFFKTLDADLWRAWRNPGAAAAVPLFILIIVFHQWADIRAELRHEASLGFMTDADVRPTAHPLLRLGSGGWADKHAHREFVRLANKIALRKRQQRDRTDAT